MTEVASLRLRLFERGSAALALSIGCRNSARFALARVDENAIRPSGNHTGKVSVDGSGVTFMNDGFARSVTQISNWGWEMVTATRRPFGEMRTCM